MLFRLRCFHSVLRGIGSNGCGEIRGCESASGEHRNAHGGEEIQADRKYAGVDVLFRRRAVEMHVITGMATVQESIFRVADGCYAGNRGELLLQVAVELLRLRVGVTGDGGIELEEQDIAGVETRIEIVKIAHGADEKTCGDENDNREGDLRDDERIAEAKKAFRVRGGSRE